jgi:hypothetical protein
MACSRPAHGSRNELSWLSRKQEITMELFIAIAAVLTLAFVSVSVSEGD